MKKKKKKREEEEEAEMKKLYTWLFKSKNFTWEEFSIIILKELPHFKHCLYESIVKIRPNQPLIKSAVTTWN